MNRRLFALLLAAAMLLALAACGKNNTPEETVPGVVSGSDDSDLDDVDVTATVPTGTAAPAVTEETTAQAETTAPTAEDPAEETTQSTAPSESETTATTAPTTPPAAEMTEYEWYNSLSGEEQMAFMESFDSVPAFFDWYNAAKEEYEQLHPSIEIGDGVIDLGDLVGGEG